MAQWKAGNAPGGFCPGGQRRRVAVQLSLPGHVVCSAGVTHPHIMVLPKAREFNRAEHASLT
jgi:hypothetical protein